MNCELLEDDGIVALEKKASLQGKEVSRPEDDVAGGVKNPWPIGPVGQERTRQDLLNTSGPVEQLYTNPHDAVSS